MMMNKPVFRISAAANMLDLHPRTLRNYEKAGLVKPARRGHWRIYSKDDISWIECLVTMIHGRGINITSVNKLLQYAPCWEIAECSLEKQRKCGICRNQR